MATDSRFEIDVLQFGLTASRLAGVFLFVSTPGPHSGGTTSKLALSACLAFCLSRAAFQSAEIRVSWETIPLSLAFEFVFGMSVGFIVGMLAEAMNCGFQLIAFQAGFSYATTIDPSSEADGGVLLVASQLFSGLLFFALGLDRVAMRAFAASLRSFPPGQGVVELLTPERMTSMFSSAVEMGFRLALPVMVVLVAIDVCLAVLGRFQAHMQLLSLAFPAKLLLSLLLIAGAAGALAIGARAIAEKSCLTLRQLGLN